MLVLLGENPEWNRLPSLECASAFAVNRGRRGNTGLGMCDAEEEEDEEVVTDDEECKVLGAWVVDGVLVVESTSIDS